MPITKESKEQHATRAEALWGSLNASEKQGIRFGLFPQAKMTEVEKEGFDGHEMSLALMDVAAKNGGMRG